MYRKTLAAIALAGGTTLLLPGIAAAWGDGSGRICYRGETIVIDNEAAWHKFLDEHPDAYDGSDGCRPNPTTTTTEATPSSTTPPTSTVPESSSTLPGPETTAPAISVVSVPPSTPSSVIVTDSVPIPPGSCLDTGQCPTAVSSPPSETPLSAPSPQPSASSTPSTLPATGDETWLYVSLTAAGAIALGWWLRRVARQAPDA